MSYALHGESADADHEGAAAAAIPLLPVDSTRYNLRDMYNADESGMFYSNSPRKTIATCRRSGRKIIKDRLTVLPVVNADGSDARQVLFIGTTAKPHCFSKKSLTLQGFQYANSKKGWMNRVIFDEWFFAFDREMSNQDRQVLLLLDNASCHKIDYKRLQELSSVKVLFLPKNTTSKLQPLDAGIIASSLKRRFQKIKMRNVCRLDELGVSDPYKLDL